MSPGSGAPSVCVYGAGRVGVAVARLCVRRGVRVEAVWNHRPPSRSRLASWEDLPVQVDETPPPVAADLWLLAVPDAAVAPVAVALAAALDADPSAARPKAAAHCAGAHPASLLGPLAERSIPVASWHPAMTFRGSEDDADALAEATVAIEGETAATGVAMALAEALGVATVSVASGSKPWYHAALVFAANGRVALDAVAIGLLAEAGIEGDAARALLAPLVERTDANLASFTAADSLTGPVARGDARTVAIQLEALASQPGELDLYRALGRVALALVPGRHRGDGHREVARLLDAKIDEPEGTPC